MSPDAELLRQAAETRDTVALAGEERERAVHSLHAAGGSRAEIAKALQLFERGVTALVGRAELGRAARS